MVEFIDDHRGEHGVEPICKLLPIAPATDYEHRAKRADPARLSDRAKRDAALRPEIRAVFSTRTGRSRAHARSGGSCAGKVSMSPGSHGGEADEEHGHSRPSPSGSNQWRRNGSGRGKPHKTTIPDKKRPCPLDKVNRQFRVPAPNMLWGEPWSAIGPRTMARDFTYVATWKGGASFGAMLGPMAHGPSPFVIDASARKIVGWHVGTSPHAVAHRA